VIEALAATATILLVVLMLLGAHSQRAVPDDVGVDGELPCPPGRHGVSSACAWADHGHHVEPFPLDRTPGEAMARLRRLVKTLPRARIVTADADYLHVEFASAVFRFVDDVEFVVDEEEGVIDVRSASRVGYSDLGVNRRRVERLRSRFLDPATPL